MSSVRQAVEWGFGKIVGLFAFVDFKKKKTRNSTFRTFHAYTKRAHSSQTVTLACMVPRYRSTSALNHHSLKFTLPTNSVVQPTTVIETKFVGEPCFKMILWLSFAVLNVRYLL